MDRQVYIRSASAWTLALAAMAASAASLVAQKQAPPSGSVAPTTVIASVADKKIVAADLHDELVAERSRAAAQGQLDAFTTAARDRAMARLVDVKLLALEAVARRLDQDPDIRRRLDNVIDQSLAGILITTVGSQVPTDDKTLRAFFAAHTADFAPSARRRARHIVVRTEAEAGALKADLAKGADFAGLAKAHNIDSTRAAGGELGWVRRGVMVKAFDNALFALKVGETSAVVHTDFGYHIVQLEEIEPARAPEFEQVKEAVRKKVLESALADFEAQLRGKYPVHVDTAVVSEVSR